jgi:hypothetical protein
MSDSRPSLDLHASGLLPGARVEVRNRFDGSWATGFEIAEATLDGCHVRRLTDGSVLPSVFPHHDLRGDTP